MTCCSAAQLTEGLIREVHEESSATVPQECEEEMWDVLILLSILNQHAQQCWKLIVSFWSP